MSGESLAPAMRRIREEQVIAVVRADSPQAAVDAASALAEGGVRAVEITFTTPEATRAIERLRDRDELFVGAGTVRTVPQAEAAIGAGAEFLVSPGLSFDVLAVARREAVAAIPGALTPTEVDAASEWSQVIKLFPASVGGPSYLRALSGPFPDLRLIPTGGVSVSNLGEWRGAGAFALGAGSDLCPPAAIAAGDFAELTRRAGAYRAALDRKAAG
ncbi:MAG: bifunctional 4-hydroxy-2-oxoglutarate aldolase/2-dehydro-3-deoxy-phosphogluconate aldolase [Solirubrobacterales bacterium]